MYDCIATIVTYNNSYESISGAINSFLSTECNVKLIIVDNSPTPALQFEVDKIPLTYHYNGENVGYGRGHNWGIFHSDPSKYHLILNPDVVIKAGSIDALVQFMDSNPTIGMVCPKVLNPDGSTQHLNKRYPTVFDLFARRFLTKELNIFFRDRLTRYETHDIGYETTCDVEFMTGCFMFCRTEILKAIGGFDERYFLHFEDCDLGRMIQKAGFRTVYFPDAIITHEWGRGPHKSFRMMLIMIRSMFQYFNKWGWRWY